MRLGSIEAGGTKFVCGIGNENMEVLERVSFPTTTPEETIKQVFEFFDKHECDAIGIGSFGPIDINKDSETYGYITTTPKPHWGNYNFLGAMKERYPNIPIGWTTDVNAAVLGEHGYGAGKGLKHVLYVTIGTGIGGGMISNNQLMEGFGAPEMGHILVQPVEGDTYKGTCPYHTCCLEGMAAGPSFDGRVGIKGSQVPTDHVAWEYVVDYVAQGINTYTLTLSPEKIILGGGVMKTDGILDRVRKRFVEINNGYAKTPNVDEYIVLPGLGDNAGLTGGFVLAKQELV